MSREATKEKALEKVITPADVREMALSLRAETDPDSIFHQVSKKLSAVSNRRNAKKKLDELLLEQSARILMASGVGNQIAITETIEPRYQPLLISFARQLIDEYRCETPSEKALAEVAALAYVRIIIFSGSLQGVRKQEFLSHEKNGFYSLLSKELDRAERHFLTSIATLKQMKAPPLSVRVTTQTALIAQNQQINAAARPLEQTNEAK